MSRINNIVTDDMIYLLKKAYKKNKTQIWKAAIKYLLKSKVRKPSVNIGKISKFTNEGDIVLVPGKVLGDGPIKHNLTIGAISYSEKAFMKIQEKGGTALLLNEFIEKFPKGEKVLLIGG